MNKRFGAAALTIALVAAPAHAQLLKAQPVLEAAPAGPPLFAWAPPPSYLPPGETTLERFVRESRHARTAGDEGVTRRRDEPHPHAAE